MNKADGAESEDGMKRKTQHDLISCLFSVCILYNSCLTFPQL